MGYINVDYNDGREKNWLVYSMVRKLMNIAEETHYAEISGRVKSNCFCSNLQNDLENSLPDLTVCINKFCCIWKVPEGNEALPEDWRCLQGLQQQDKCFHCAEDLCCATV